MTTIGDPAGTLIPEPRVTPDGIGVTEWGAGPAVGWLHGYTMDSSLWAPLWDELPGRRHLGIDLPDHGASSTGFGGRTLSQVADQFADLLRRSDCRRLVALSFGSMLAIQVAVDHPDVLDELVLAAPTLAGAGDDPAAANRYLQVSMARSLGADAAALTELWMAAPPDIFTGTLSVPRVRERIATVVRRHRWAELLDGSMARLRTGTSHDPELLGTIRARTTVIVGEHDMPDFRLNARLLAGSVPDCRVDEVAGAGHLPLLENPVAAGALLRRALGAR